MSESIVIVGAGHAAGQLVASLRQGGFEGSLQVIGDEPHLPYQRPPLSKTYLAGALEADELNFRPAEFYQKAGAEMLTGTRVDVINRPDKQLKLGDGRTLHYTKLALTTGSRVRRLTLPGSDLDAIYYLRNIADVDAIRQHLKQGAKLVICGGGYIGLEVAAVCAKQGLDVTVLEMADRVMNRVVAPVVSQFYETVHREAGVKIETSVQVSGFEGSARVEQVRCTDGSTYAADLVVIGVGVIPNSELAAEAGLATDNGIVVDQFTQTADPDIVAAGDCTNHPSHRYGSRIRLESVQNAVDQAKAAAATLCGEPVEYTSIPWFWSDQYDLKLQIAGLSQGHDAVIVRGNPTGGAFAVFYLQQGDLLAVDAINRPQEFMLSKRLIAARTQLDPERIEDTAIPMKELAA